jgi:hypothetical protein
MKLLLAFLLIVGITPAYAEDRKPTIADVGRAACSHHEAGIPLGRAMQIAAVSEMGATLRLSMAASTDEFVRIIHGATAKACPKAWAKEAKRQAYIARQASLKACSDKLNAVPTADRLTVMMQECK